VLIDSPARLIASSLEKPSLSPLSAKILGCKGFLGKRAALILFRPRRSCEAEELKPEARNRRSSTSSLLLSKSSLISALVTPICF
jgi:hypothetical protein